MTREPRRAGKRKPQDPGAAEVDAYLAELEHPRKAEIEALRKIVLAADARIRQEIKWNAPSFRLEEHFATFRLRPGDTLQLVLHTGAKAKAPPKALEIDDPQGLLKWAAKDRCVLTFGDVKDIRSKKAGLTAILAQWIARS